MWFWLACTAEKGLDTGVSEQVISPLAWSVQEMGPFRVGYQQGVHSYSVLERSHQIDMNVWGKSKSYYKFYKIL